MKHLTRREAEVIRSLLAAQPGTEVERIRASGLARSTYQSVRRRALEFGWLVERFVPSPALLGAGSVEVSLERPFAEEWGSTALSRERNPSTVYLSLSAQSVLVVEFPQSYSAPMERPQEDRSWRVSIRPSGGGVPAFFDMEGAWSSGVLGKPPLRYPQGLPGGWDDLSHPLPDLGPFSNGVSRLLSSRPGGTPALTVVAADRAERDLVQQGLLVRRSFPVLERLPHVLGREIDYVVFVTGRCQGELSARSLLASLMDRARVFPFLFAYDEERVLFAGLAPIRTLPPRTPQSVTAVLTEHLSRIEIVREPLSTWKTRVPHRYGMLARLRPS